MECGAEREVLVSRLLAFAFLRDASVSGDIGEREISCTRARRKENTGEKFAELAKAILSAMMKVMKTATTTATRTRTRRRTTTGRTTTIHEVVAAPNVWRQAAQIS